MTSIGKRDFYTTTVRIPSRNNLTANYKLIKIKSLQNHKIQNHKIHTKSQNQRVRVTDFFTTNDLEFNSPSNKGAGGI